MSVVDLTCVILFAVVLQAREIDSLKDQRDKQMSEMKNIAQEKGMSIQTNFEKKVSFFCIC